MSCHCPIYYEKVNLTLVSFYKAMRYSALNIANDDCIKDKL